MLCYDSDEAGQKGAREVAQRLGVERCRIATFGQAKDANEYLTEHKAGGEDFDHAIRAARYLTPTNCDRCPISWAMWWRCSTRRTIPQATEPRVLRAHLRLVGMASSRG